MVGWVCAAEISSVAGLGKVVVLSWLYQAAHWRSWEFSMFHQNSPK
jgi:hypothetical protein